jgi:hypothetical protein
VFDEIGAVFEGESGRGSNIGELTLNDKARASRTRTPLHRNAYSFVRSKKIFDV